MISKPTASYPNYQLKRNCQTEAVYTTKSERNSPILVVISLMGVFHCIGGLLPVNYGQYPVLPQRQNAGNIDSIEFKLCNKSLLEVNFIIEFWITKIWDRSFYGEWDPFVCSWLSFVFLFSEDVSIKTDSIVEILKQFYCWQRLFQSNYLYYAWSAVRGTVHFWSHILNIAIEGTLVWD